MLKISSLIEIISEFVVAVIVWLLDLHLPMQSIPITTDVVSLKFDQALCDKVCQWLATCRWLSPGPPFHPPIKLTAILTSLNKQHQQQQQKTEVKKIDRKHFYSKTLFFSLIFLTCPLRCYHHLAFHTYIKSWVMNFSH